MDNLVIPFAHESFAAFDLVENERNDVEQQLDERRIAMQQIRDMGHAYGEGDIVIDVDNDTINTTDGVIAQEANTTLAIMVKAILRGVKDYGVANENIVEATIIANDNSCLLKEYASFYSNAGFSAILDAFISIGNKVYQNDTETVIENVPSLQKIKELDDNGIDEDEVSVETSIDQQKYLVSIPILDYINNLKDITVNFICLNRKAQDIYRGDNADATNPDTIDCGTLKNWETQTLSSLEAKTSSKFVRLVIDLNKAFTHSLSNLYSQISTNVENYGDEELNDHLKEISVQYSILCSNSEYNLVSERTSALESYIGNLMAIEAFRDSKVGRLLNNIYQFIRVIIRMVLETFDALVDLVLDKLLNLIVKINAILIDSKTKEKIQKINSAGVVVYFNYDLTKPRFYARIDDKVLGFDVSINGLVSGVSLNTDATFLPPKAKAIKLDRLSEVIKTLSESKENNEFTVSGYIVKFDIAGTIAAVVADLIGNLRDANVDLLRNGKTDKIERGINNLKIVLTNTASKLQIPMSNKTVKLQFSPITTPNDDSNNLQRILNNCLEIKNAISEIGGVNTRVSNIRSVFDGDIGNDPRYLEILSRTFKVSSDKIKRTIKDLNKVFDSVSEDEDSAQRVTVAKEYTKAVGDASKIITKAISNTIQLGSKVKRFECYSDLISIRLINAIYKNMID